MVPPPAPFVLRHADRSYGDDPAGPCQPDSFIPASPSISGSHDMSRPPPKPAPCPGIRVRWSIGSIGLTYPFQQHNAANMSYELSGYLSDHDGEWLLLRSHHCLKYVMPMPGRVDAPACRFCATITSSAEYRKMLDRATMAMPHTPWDYLNEMQCRALMDKLQSQVRQLRLKVSCIIV